MFGDQKVGSVRGFVADGMCLFEFKTHMTVRETVSTNPSNISTKQLFIQHTYTKNIKKLIFLFSNDALN